MKLTYIIMVLCLIAAPTSLGVCIGVFIREHSQTVSEKILAKYGKINIPNYERLFYTYLIVFGVSLGYLLGYFKLIKGW